jgi:shikimate dehydrogenase
VRVICGAREWQGRPRSGRPWLVVNATPVGLYPDAAARPEVDSGSLRPGLTVADVVSNPPQTAFLRDAAGQGCVTLDGLACWAGQG